MPVPCVHLQILDIVVLPFSRAGNRLFGVFEGNSRKNRDIQNSREGLSDYGFIIHYKHLRFCFSISSLKFLLSLSGSQLVGSSIRSDRE